MANFVEILNPRFILFEPDPENIGEWQDGYYHNWAITHMLLNQLDSPSHLIAGSYTGGNLVDIKIEFIAPSVLETVTFSSTAVNITTTRQIWYADRSTGNIESMDLPGYAALADNPDHFPLLLTGHFQQTTTTTAPFSQWLPKKRQPRTDLVPIGSIIGIHPDVNPTKALNLEYYQQCNGNGVDTCDLEYPDGTTQSIVIPDLTDNRFLMGGLTAGTGGSNVLQDHVHTCGDNSATHTHDVNITSSSTEGHSTDHTHGGDDYYTAYMSAGGGSAAAGGDRSVTNTHGTNSTSGTSNDHTHNVNLGTINSDAETDVHIHSIGSGTSPTLTSNLPKYFKVLYFIRRK